MYNKFTLAFPSTITAVSSSRAKYHSDKKSSHVNRKQDKIVQNCQMIWQVSKRQLQRSDAVACGLLCHRETTASFWGWLCAAVTVLMVSLVVVLVLT